MIRYYMGFEIKISRDHGRCKATFWNDARLFTVFGTSFKSTFEEAADWIKRLVGK